MNNYLKVIYLSLSMIFLVSCFTNQDLSISYRLSPGMTKDQVMNIMGPPIKSDFDRNVEEWFYCKTGGSTISGMFSMVDDHLVLFFVDGVLLTKHNYSVTLNDVKGYGSCEQFIKRGDYRVPDEVLEIRLKH